MIDIHRPENWDVPLFPVAVVAQAALLDVATLRQWIVRYGDTLRLWAPKDADGSAIAAGAKAESAGLAHKLSLRGALHVAAAAQLTRKGVQVKDAYMATSHWVHVGDMSQAGYWLGEEQPSVTRLPAGLFPDPAWTFLIHHAGDTARVVPVARDGEALPFRFSDLFAYGHPVFTPPTIIFLNKVDHYVRGVCEGFLRQ